MTTNNKKSFKINEMLKPSSNIVSYFVRDNIEVDFVAK